MGVNVFMGTGFLFGVMKKVLKADKTSGWRFPNILRL